MRIRRAQEVDQASVSASGDQQWPRRLPTWTEAGSGDTTVQCRGLVSTSERKTGSGEPGSEGHSDKVIFARTLNTARTRARGHLRTAEGSEPWGHSDANCVYAVSLPTAARAEQGKTHASQQLTYCPSGIFFPPEIQALTFNSDANSDQLQNSQFHSENAVMFSP